MRLKFLFIFLMLYSCSFILAAETESALNPNDLKAKLSTDNNEDENPPEPINRTLKEPDFNLKNLQPVNAASLAQLQLTSAVLGNSDLADTTSGNSSTTNTIFFNRAALNAMPRIGDRTRLSANISGSFIRYDNKSINDYDVLNANLGIYQKLTDNMSAELGWRYSQYYVQDKIIDQLNDNPHNLQEQGARLALNRIDKLPANFFLTSNYELQVNFSDPVDRSRLTHFFSTGLGYNLNQISDKLQAMLYYRLKHDDFFYRTLNDSANRHELQAQLSFQATKAISLAGTVSYLFGDSVDLLRNPALDTGNINSRDANSLKNLAFGVRVNANFAMLD